MLRRVPRLATILSLLLSGFAGSASAQPGGEVTDDGLVRAPSSRAGIVYRSPDVNFAQYRRVQFDPVAAAFKPGWRRENRKLSEAEVERIRSRAAEQFHDELESELTGRGHYPLAESPAPDVLRIKASIVDLDRPAPNAGNVPGVRSYARSTGEMTLLVELYDAASGILVARIITPQHAKTYSVPQFVDQVTIETDAAIAFANAARLTREALNVALTERRAD
jgi:hypothetical protein